MLFLSIGRQYEQLCGGYIIEERKKKESDTLTNQRTRSRLTIFIINYREAPKLDYVNYSFDFAVSSCAASLFNLSIKAL